jgi:hypothetical protein
MDGYVEGTGEHTHTFHTRDWIVTEHDVFRLVRQGNMNFAKIPVVASKNMPHDAMDAIEPYDYTRLVPFNKGYLPGFLASRYDISQDVNKDKAFSRAARSLENSLDSTLVGFEAVQKTGADIRPRHPDAKYALMPAYLLFMDYDNDEDKMIAINGQTGKVVGNIPVDKGKRNRYFLSRFLLISLLIFVFILLFWLFA